ncbi:uncharacterized protein LOC110041939 [Orbicella faveolata]|uniref:uncharacterized protein LOC110041939 n=1 Tax=Orbicella faveolata TaxID=48498 RepID=UPI0009E1B945|nr:uncharacterized protein LOC110041939 [Orbicella faveolata]
MLCCNCGKQVTDGMNYCSNCGKELSSTGNAGQSPPSCTVPSSSAASSFSSAAVHFSNAIALSSSACVSGKAIKSFSAYREWKGHQWKEHVSRTTAKDKEKEVAVAIGLMEFTEKESKLKPVREKRVMLQTSNRAPILISVSSQGQSLKPIIETVTKREKNTDYCMRMARMPSFYLEQQSSSA